MWDTEEADIIVYVKQGQDTFAVLPVNGRARQAFRSQCKTETQLDAVLAQAKDSFTLEYRGE